MKNEGYVSVTLKNLSDRSIPQEVVDNVLFNNVDNLNKIAEEYNLKVIELKNIYNEDKELIEQELVIGDSYK